MDARSILMRKIKDNLSFYAKAIQTNTTSGRTDILIDAEEICCNLLNMAFGYNLKLLNQVKRNYPAIDMADDERGVAVQVTSSNTRTKVENTLVNFRKHDLDTHYHTLLIFILVLGPKFRQRDKFDIPPGLELQIMTFSDFLHELEALSEEHLEKIAKYLDAEIGADTPTVSADAIPALATGTVERLTETACQTLRFAALLHESGLDRNVFEYGLEPAQRKTLPDLLESGILFQKESALFLHPDIRINVRPASDHRAFLDRLWNYEKSWHWERVSMKREYTIQRNLAQIFGAAAEYYPERAVVYALRSAELYRITQQYGTALQLEQKALNFLESGKRDSWSIARAHHFIGECYTAIQEHALALKEWKKTLALCKKPLHAFDLDIAEAYHNIGKALLELNQYEEAEENLLVALKSLESFRRGCSQFDAQPWMKDIYRSLATTYLLLRQDTLVAKCNTNAQCPPAEQEDLWETLVAEQSKRKFHSELAELHLPPYSTLDADSFVGREAELKTIEQKLRTREKPIILSGLGGIGKTELAVQFGLSYKDGDVYFIRFTESFTATVTTMFKGIRPQPQDPPPELEQYNTVMSLLANRGKKDILIIDNVDADSGTLRDLMKDDTYKKLLVMKLQLILTTRFDEARSVGVRPLPNKALYEIFYKHGAFLEESQMDELIAAVNGHTLTIDLMARILNGKGWRKVTAEMMLDAIRNNTLPGKNYRKIATDYNQSEDQAQIYQHLRILFDVNGIPYEAQNVMQCATLLPEGGMNGEYFYKALSEPQQQAFEDLIDHGWLAAEDGLLTIHPVIRLICRQELNPNEEICGPFLDALWVQYDPIMYERINFAQLAEVFANALDIDGTPEAKAKWLNNSGWLLLDLMESWKCATLYETYIPALEMQIPNHPAIATAYNNVGMTCGDLGDHYRALEYQLKALAIREKVLPPEHPDLASSYNNLGYTYGRLGDHYRALEYQLKTLAIREKVLSPEHPDLAQAYNNVGSTYGALGDHQKALEYIQKALTIRKKVLPPYHPDLAASYNNVGSTYDALGDHQKALEHKLKALAISEKVLSKTHPSLASTYSNVGRTYGDLGNHIWALEHERKTLAIREKVLPPEHPDLAVSYSNMGMTYGNLGNHEKALEYMQRAMTIQEKILPQNHPDLAVSYSNAGSTYGVLGDHNKALEYNLKALAIQEKTLPPTHPALAVSYDALGQIYDDLGQRDHALEYMLRALDIRNAVLPPTHPSIAQSCSNIAWVYYVTGDFSRALENMRKAVSVAEQSLPEGHPHLLQYRTDLKTMERDIRQ